MHFPHHFRLHHHYGYCYLKVDNDGPLVPLKGKGNKGANGHNDDDNDNPYASVVAKPKKSHNKEHAHHQVIAESASGTQQLKLPMQIITGLSELSAPIPKSRDDIKSTIKALNEKSKQLLERREKANSELDARKAELRAKIDAIRKQLEAVGIMVDEEQIIADIKAEQEGGGVDTDVE